MIELTRKNRVLPLLPARRAVATLHSAAFPGVS